MAVKSKLKNALDLIQNALRKLKHSSLGSPEDINIKKAIRELKDAIDDIEYSIKNIDD